MKYTKEEKLRLEELQAKEDSLKNDLFYQQTMKQIRHLDFKMDLIMDDAKRRCGNKVPIEYRPEEEWLLFSLQERSDAIYYNPEVRKMFRQEDCLHIKKRRIMARANKRQNKQ